MITDNESAAGLIIDMSHYKLNNGKLFAGCATATIGANTTGYFVIRPTSCGQLEYTINSTGAFKSTLYEAPTLVTNTGETSFTMISRNRCDTTVSVPAIYVSEPTANVGTTAAGAKGTRLATVIGGGAFGIGSNISDFNWKISVANTYMLQIQNANAANTTDVSVCINIYSA